MDFEWIWSISVFSTNVQKIEQNCLVFSTGVQKIEHKCLVFEI